jgi:hypothetical protein
MRDSWPPGRSSPAQLATLPANATIVNDPTSGSGLKNGACNSHARRANWVEARFGRQQDKGDGQFGYTHMLIEQEAVPRYSISATSARAATCSRIA